MEKDIYLIGFMGCGKSAVGRVLAEKLSAEVMEMDAALEEESGRKISEIFKEEGETFFREMETGWLKRRAGKVPAVISCGGGVPMREENVRIMRENGTVILLEARPETVFERVRYSHHRPLLEGRMNVGYIRELMEKRRPAYEAAADLTIGTDGRTVREISDGIRNMLETRS